MKKALFLLAVGLTASFLWTQAHCPKISPNAFEHSLLAQFRGHIENVKDGDSVTLYLWDPYICESKEMTLPHHEQNAYIHNGYFSFNAERISHPVYISIRNLSTRTYLEHYIAEPGDNIFIDVQSKGFARPEAKVHFSGVGIAKYDCKYQLVQHNFEAYVYGTKGVYCYSKTKLDSVNYLSVMSRVLKSEDSLRKELIGVLNGYKSALSPNLYITFKLDVNARIDEDKLIYFGDEVVGYFEKNKSLFTDERLGSKYDSLVSFYEKYLPNYTIRGGVPSQIVNSRNYIAYLLRKYKVEGKLRRNKDSYYDDIKTHTTGILRDRLITSWLSANFEFLKNGDQIIVDALGNVKNEYCQNILQTIASSQMKGSAAYNFALPDTSGKIIHLSDFKGKVVFIDFWYDHCGACQSYYVHELSKVEEIFKNRPEVVFITVNIDNDREEWLSAIHDGRHTSPNIVNLYTGGAGLNDPVIQHYNVQAYPRPLLIDYQGRVFENTEKFLRDGTGESLVHSINEAINQKMVSRVN